MSLHDLTNIFWIVAINPRNKMYDLIFCIIPSCNSTEVHWHFGRTYLLHLKGCRAGQGRNQHQAGKNNNRCNPEYRILHRHQCESLKTNNEFNIYSASTRYLKHLLHTDKWKLSLLKWTGTHSWVAVGLSTHRNLHSYNETYEMCFLCACVCVCVKWGRADWNKGLCKRANCGRIFNTSKLYCKWNC
jgi:hypothetical protein